MDKCKKRGRILSQNEIGGNGDMTYRSDLAEKKLNWGQIKNNNLTQHGCKVEL